MEKFAELAPHGDLEEAFQDVFVVHGTACMGPGITFPRTMTVIRNPESGELQPRQCCAP